MQNCGPHPGQEDHRLCFERSTVMALLLRSIALVENRITGQVKRRLPGRLPEILTQGQGEAQVTYVFLSWATLSALKTVMLHSANSIRQACWQADGQKQAFL